MGETEGETMGGLGKTGGELGRRFLWARALTVVAGGGASQGEPVGLSQGDQARSVRKFWLGRSENFG